MQGRLSVPYNSGNYNQFPRLQPDQQVNATYRVRQVVFVMIALVVGFGGIRSMAQAAPGVYADAHSPSGTPDPEKLDAIWTVNNITGALSVKIPFPTGPVGGRGPKIPFALLYNSSATVTLQEEANYSDVMDLGYAVISSSIVTFGWMPGSYNASTTPAGPWSTTGPFLTDVVTTIPTYTPTYTVNGTQIDGPTVTGCQISGPYLYSDETGSSHDMNVAYVNSYVGGSSDSQCNRYSGTPTSATTLDGSTLQTTIPGIGANIGLVRQDGSSPAILYPNGTQYLGNAGYWTSGKLEDANGNIASLAQDSAGRTPFATTLPIARVGEISPKTYTVTTQGASGNNETYSVTVSLVPVGVWTMPHPHIDPNNPTTSEICCFNPNSANNVVASIASMTPSTVSAVTAITLSNGTAYGFTYDSLYGTIQKITFPTGGYVRFVWGIRDDCGGYGDFKYVSCLVVKEAYISSGSGEEHWSYSFPSYVYGSNQLTSTVTAPDDSYTSYTGTATQYSSNIFPWGAPSWQEISKLTYTPDGKLLESVATTYAGDYPAQIATTIYDGATPLQKQTRLKYDGYENVIEEDESDYYPCSGSPCAAATNPPSWLRKTFTNYLWSSPNPTQPSYPYSQARIVDKPSQVAVTDGSGRPVSMIQYNYDEFSLSGNVGILNHDDANYPATMVGPRGNLTSEKHCLTFSGSNCASWNAPTTYRYDLAGMVVSKTDPKSYMTTYGYTDAYQGFTPSQPTDAYASTVTRPSTNGISHVDTYTYYFQTGKVASHTDENLKQTQYQYNDPLNRIKKIILPVTVDGTTGSSTTGYTSFFYNDTSGSVSVNQQQLMNASGGTKGTNSRTTYYDGLGRVSRSTIDSDPYGADEVDTTYDSMGRIYTISNPYRSTSEFTYGLTTYTYDTLGRTRSKANPDGSTSQSWNYNGNLVTFTDEVLNQWQRVYDGAGRLTKVLEPSGTFQASSAQTPTLETDYSYDALGNLLSANQCGGACPSSITVARSFSYDGLSQLIRAFNPETGWICYGTTGGAVPNGSNCTSGYDGDGNLNYKTDSRGIQTSYSFDPLNRLISKSYSNDSGATPSSCYQYDSSTIPNGIGRLSSEWTQSASAGSCPSSPPSHAVWSRRSILAYDAMGRVLQEQQCTPANCSVGTPYAPAYTYDLAGNTSTFTNGVTSTPSVGTLTFTNNLDGAGRLLNLTSNWSDPTHPATLFSAQSLQSGQCPDSTGSPYAAFGGLLNATYGSGPTLNRSFDKRLRMTCAIGTGNIAASATSGSATVTITGSEQSH